MIPKLSDYFVESSIGRKGCFSVCPIDYEPLKLSKYFEE